MVRDDSGQAQAHGYFCGETKNEFQTGYIGSWGGSLYGH
jgi:hypothetical protein